MFQWFMYQIVTYQERFNKWLNKPKKLQRKTLKCQKEINMSFWNLQTAVWLPFVFNFVSCNVVYVSFSNFFLLLNIFFYCSRYQCAQGNDNFIIHKIPSYKEICMWFFIKRNFLNPFTMSPIAFCSTRDITNNKCTLIPNSMGIFWVEKIGKKWNWIRGRPKIAYMYADHITNK